MSLRLSKVQAPQLHLLPVVMLGLLSTFNTRVATADTIYRKVFYAEAVKADAQIKAGARVQTWSGAGLHHGEIVTLSAGPPPVVRGYTHATERTGHEVINGGLPVNPTGNTVAEGWSGGPIVAIDGHVNPNVARVETMSVTTAANVNIPIWDPELKHLTRIPLLNPAARGIIQGGSRAGPPEDKHNFHSADSFAAIEIDAFRTFVQTKVNGQDRLVGVANNTMVGGGFNAHDGGKETKDIDPLYLRVRDLDTGASITEEILTQNIFSRDATYSLTDAGLEFQINPLNPLSFVELEFHADSPWVSNPYAYGARFDSGRLTISGDRYPLADWQITQMGSRKRAFIPFGPDGSLFDMVEALPPDNLFTVGHNYQYDVGAGSGSFEIASSVPEPGSMFLVGLTATLGTTFIRRRRPK